MKLDPSYDMSKFRLETSGILNVIMGSGPRLASPNFILGGGLFSGGGGYELYPNPISTRNCIRSSIVINGTMFHSCLVAF